MVSNTSSLKESESGRLSEIITDRINEITTTKKITRGGNALQLSITKEAEALGVGQGDIVEIVIRRI